jgi:hypothetical protein
MAAGVATVLAKLDALLAAISKESGFLEKCKGCGQSPDLFSSRRHCGVLCKSTHRSSKIDPVEILIEFLFDRLRPLEFRPRLFNVGLPGEIDLAKPVVRTLKSHIFRGRLICGCLFDSWVQNKPYHEIAPVLGENTLVHFNPSPHLTPRTASN